MPAPKDVTKEGSKLYFPTLLNGSERAECVLLRQRLYEETWARVDERIQVHLLFSISFAPVNEFIVHPRRRE
jgi:hypothetical protein